MSSGQTLILWGKRWCGTLRVSVRFNLSFLTWFCQNPTVLGAVFSKSHKLCFLRLKMKLIVKCWFVLFLKNPSASRHFLCFMQNFVMILNINWQMCSSLIKLQNLIQIEKTWSSSIIIHNNCLHSKQLLMWVGKIQRHLWVIELIFEVPFSSIYHQYVSKQFPKANGRKWFFGPYRLSKAGSNW